MTSTHGIRRDEGVGASNFVRRRGIRRGSRLLRGLPCGLLMTALVVVLVAGCAQTPPPAPGPLFPEYLETDAPGTLHKTAKLPPAGDAAALTDDAARELAAGMTPEARRQVLLGLKETLEGLLRNPGPNDAGRAAETNLRRLGMIFAEAHVKAGGDASVRTQWENLCKPLVPLAMFDRFVFKTGDILMADVKFANRGPGAFTGSLWASMYCLIVAGEELGKHEAPAGGLSEAMPFYAPPDDGVLGTVGNQASSGKVEVIVSDENNDRVATNTWEIWLFPDHTREDALNALYGIHVATTLDAAALAQLDAGKTVLLLQDEAARERIAKEEAANGRRPREERAQARFFPDLPACAGNALSVACDPEHPLLAGFPTETHASWQWWHLVKSGMARSFTPAGPEHRPAVWATPVAADSKSPVRPWILFEGTAGKGNAGKLVVCCMDKETLFKRPEGLYLLIGIARRVKSPEFRPAHPIHPAQTW